MSTPIETVTEAVARSGYRYPSDIASTALGSLRQHRDDIARVLREHPNGARSIDGSVIECDCGQRVTDFRLHQADAVLDFLDGGAS